MTKIVINNQHGGFSLSDAATELYLNLRGLAWTKKTDPNGDFASLEIIDLQPGTKYRIQEYDGAEWIETESDIEWSIA